MVFLYENVLWNRSILDYLINVIVLLTFCIFKDNDDTITLGLNQYKMML